MQDAASCKGLMKLYALDGSQGNLQMRVAMRVFNVDRIRPANCPRNILAVDRSAQTEQCSINREIQTVKAVRNAAVQVRFKFCRIFTYFKILNCISLILIYP